MSSNGYADNRPIPRHRLDDALAISEQVEIHPLRYSRSKELMLQESGSITSVSRLGLAVEWQQYQNVGEGTPAGMTQVTSQNFGMI